MNPSLKYRNNKVDYHSAEAKRVLNDAHGSPIYGTLAALNNSPDGIPLDCDYDCEHWLHSAVASMYADATVETLAPSIKSDCHRCALAICDLFEKNRLLHSPDGTRNERIWIVPRPTLWTLHQMLPNKDPDQDTLHHVMLCLSYCNMCVHVCVLVLCVVAQCPCAVLAQALASLSDLPPAFLCHTHPP